MRILTLTNLFPNPYQPHRAPFNRQQLRALAAEHAVAVIAPIAWTDELAAWWNGRGRWPGDRRTVCEGMTVDHPRYLFPPKVLRGWYGSFFRTSVRRAFDRALAEFRPDLVFAPWAYPDGWAAVELGHQAGLPVVIKVHGSDVLGLARQPGRRRRTVEALGRADGIVAVSRDLAERVAAMGVDRQRIQVVYDGIDAGLFHPGPLAEARARLGLDPGDPIVLFIGNLVPVKGIDVLVDACARLARDGARFTCYLIGQGPLRPQLERRIARRDLAGRVVLAGPRPHHQLPDWYRSATVFVLPSHSEGVPCVLLEAAACATPFVASQVGGIPEIAHLGASRLVPPGDAGRLAQAIAEFITGPGRSPAALAAPRSHQDAAAELAGLFGRLIRTPARTRPACEVPPRDGVPPRRAPSGSPDVERLR